MPDDAPQGAGCSMQALPRRRRRGGPAARVVAHGVTAPSSGHRHERQDTPMTLRNSVVDLRSILARASRVESPEIGGVIGGPTPGDSY